MKRPSRILFILWLFMLSACGGGGMSASSPESPAQPITITVPGIAYQDKQYSIDLSSVPSISTVSLQNGPSWMAFNSSTKTIGGVPDDNTNISNLKILITKSDGTAETLGPYAVTVNGDPLRKYQWHLKNTGQANFAVSSGVLGNDINQSQTALDGITGSAIKVAVSDSGVEIAHEDLSANIIPGASKNYNLAAPYVGDPTPTDSAHGTAVAGIIGAVGWNAKGGRGVAPNSRIAGLRFIGTSQSTATKIDQASGSFDVFNYSYGGVPFLPKDEDQTYFSQLRYGTTNQRGGKGSIYVKSAGNEYDDFYPSQAPFLTQADALANCPFPASIGGANYVCSFLGNSNLGSPENVLPDVIVVGALNAKGKRSSYSSPGSNIWISAPGGEYGSDDPAIMTTDLQGCDKGMSSTLVTPANSFENSTSLNANCKYTSTMNGTSSAAPVTTGAIALMLEANPNLTWRDVKYILAATATKTDPSAGNTAHEYGFNLAGHTYQQGWIQNSAGFWFHNWYGFGRVNVDNAVALAKSYSATLNPLRITQSTSGAWYYSSGSISQAIPDNSATGTSSSINVRHNFIVEAVQVKFGTTHPLISDLGVELTSPSGTKNILLNINSGIIRNTSMSYDAILLSNAFFGEQSSGNWTLKVIDGASSSNGSLVGWAINVYGHKNPSSGDTTAPNPPSALTMAQYFNSTSSTPLASFTPSTSPDVIRYEYSVGTTSGGTSIREWSPIALNTSFSATGLTLTNGSTYFLNIRAVDTSENISTVVSKSWIVDVTPPTASITSLANNSVVNSTTGTLTGTCDANSTVNITSTSGITVGSATCDASGNLSISYTITGPTGKKTFTYTLTDLAGNTSSSATFTIIYVDKFHEVLSVGDNHACGINNGAVKCWGRNTSGQLGDNSTTTRNSPVAVSGLSSGAISVAAGSNHTCAVKSDGTVWCWGNNESGSLGNGSTTNSSVPVQVSGITTATQVSSGYEFSCALLSAGSVKCWGFGGVGSLGNGASADSSTPVNVSSISTAVKISTSRGAHTCALLSSGGVKCWGYNVNGQLGNNTTTDSNTPVDVIGLTSGVDDIQTSSFSTCAKTSASTKCWGWNQYYQLGNGSTVNSPTPSTVSSVTGFQQYGLGDIASCAISSSGKLQCWGSPANNLLDSTTLVASTSSAQDISNLTQDVVLVRVGFSFACGVKVDGSIKCWGKRSEGELGNNQAGGDGLSNTTKYTSLLTGISTSVSGENHTCVIKTDGSVWCAGKDGNGQLGLGNNFLGNDLGFDRFHEISTLNGQVAQISAGQYHTCARTTSSGVKCWGRNFNGELSTGDTNDRSTPTDVVGLSGTVVDISSGGYHSCAVLSTGNVYCWGRNNYGQLGNGSTTTVAVTSPQQVSGVTTATSVSTGLYHSCARLSGGGVKCWGRNDSGQLGGGSMNTWNTATTPSISNVVSVSCGYWHSCALQSSGNVMCWGENSSGQLGNNDTGATDQSAPAQVYGITSGVAQISSGGYHSCARTTGGVIKCWGANGLGQLGAGLTSTNYVSSWDVTGISSSANIALGENHSCSLSTSATLQCWGKRLFGQFGDGIAYGTTSSVNSFTLF